MEGKIVTLRDESRDDKPLGVETGGVIFPLTSQRGSKRNLQPGEEITYMTLRDGKIYVFPRPRINRERGR